MFCDNARLWRNRHRIGRRSLNEKYPQNQQVPVMCQLWLFIAFKGVMMCFYLDFIPLMWSTCTDICNFWKKIVLKIFLSKEKGCVLNINSLPLGIRWLHSNYFFDPGVYDLGGFDLLGRCMPTGKSSTQVNSRSNTWTLLIDMASYGINSILAV